MNAQHATAIVGENLPKPRASEGIPLGALMHATSSFGRLYDLTFEPAEERPVPPGARLQVQLASNGKTRILIVRSGHPNTDWRWTDLLRGRHSLQIVPDQGWVDLGPIPPAGEPLEAQVVGLLPGPFGFFQLYLPRNEHFGKIAIVRPESPRARPLATVPRYRLRVAAPVPAGELLARLFFFVSVSRVLAAAGVLALGLLFVGWRLLSGSKVAPGVCCLLPSVVLLHAVCLPPLQGADETSHAATIETVVFLPERMNDPSFYPSSFSRVAKALRQDLVQYDPEIPLPIAGAISRAELGRLLASGLTAEARTGGPPAPAAALQSIRSRSPFFFRAFQPLAPILRGLSIGDRLAAYRLLSTAFALLFFCFGAFLLSRAALPAATLILYALVFLIPYIVAVTASCSNYAPAAGLGALLAACVLTLVLSSLTMARATAALTLLLGSWIGVGFWDDFVFLATLASLGAFVFALTRIPRVSGGMRLALAAALIAAGSAVVFLSGRGVQRVFSNLGARLPREMPRFGNPIVAAIAGVVAAPFTVALLLVLMTLVGRRVSEARRVRAAWLRTGLAALIFIALFLATPYTVVPIDTRLGFIDEVRAHWESFWSNNFSWDQDFLFWKLYWGVFGWTDAPLPDLLYAAARWVCVGLFLVLPILSGRFAGHRPGPSAILLLVSGVMLSLCIVTETIRYFQPSTPWGRYLLPWLPLAALPVLVRTEAPGRERALFLILKGAVALHLWTAITLLGTRYYLGS